MGFSPPSLIVNDAARRSVRHCSRQNYRQHYAGHMSPRVHVCSYRSPAL